MAFDNNPLRTYGFQAEEKQVKYLSEIIFARKKPWKIYHSICENVSSDLPNVQSVSETPALNAKMGDVRIFKVDPSGKPIQGKGVFVDVKASLWYPYGTVTFPIKDNNVKQSAIDHFCGFLGRDSKGRDISSDFWYLSCGSDGRWFFRLADIRNFIISRTEQELRSIMMESRYDKGNSSTRWFSFDSLPEGIIKFGLEEWIDTVLTQRLA